MLRNWILATISILAIGTIGFTQIIRKDIRDRVELKILQRFADDLSRGEQMYILSGKAPSQKTLRTIEKRFGVRIILSDDIMIGQTTYWFENIKLTRKQVKVVFVRHWAGSGESFRVTYFFDCSRKSTSNCRLTKISRSES